VLPFHALIFRGLLRRIARHAAPPSAAHPSTFTYCSIVDAPAAEVFRWHEHPGALAALTPAALVRIEERHGGIRDGGRVTLSVGIGPARARWLFRHHGYIPSRRFCDEQVRGPFAVWRHAHLFEPMGPSQTLYEDRVEFAVAGRGMRNRFVTAVIRSMLTVAFAYRHRIVRNSVGRARRQAPRRWATAAVVLAAAAVLQTTAATAQTTAPPRTVPVVDLDRYAGDWFEIARLPNRFQRQCVGDVRASYARRTDGRIDVVNQCRTGDGRIQARGVARVVDERSFARLKVRFAPSWLTFLPFVWGDYWIIGLADDYSWAVVGSPDREYLWILARTPRLDDERAAAARGIARANGFDVERLIEAAQ
jgi:apolipoprotein D and lipocalin family protein